MVDPLRGDVPGGTSRRRLLAGLASGGAWILAGCKAWPRGRRSSATAWDDLAAELDGDVLVRAGDGYEQRRRDVQWNGRKEPRHPEAIVAVASTDDVRAAVRFADRAGLRVAVRGGGHSWCGSPVRDGGLLLDLDRLRAVELDPDAREARCQPAVRGGDLIRATLPHGLAFPVGHCLGVPLSGYLLSGGFGWNGGTWGPACASVLGVDVVDARGELLRADAERNADLFWAARGAGPGFPGVVTRFRLRLHAAPRAIRTTALEFDLADLERVGAWLPELRAALPPGVELTCLIARAPARGDGNPRGRSLQLSATAFAEDDAQARDWLAPLETGAGETAARISRLQETPFESLLEAMGSHFPGGRRYGSDVLWSDAPPAQVLGALAAKLASAPSPDSFALCVPVPPPPAGVPPLPDMAFGLFAPMFAGVYGCWSRADDDPANLAWLRDAQQSLQPLATGHYVGESDLTAAPDRARHSFTETAWRTLATVRSRRDPDGRFFSFLTPEEA